MAEAAEPPLRLILHDFLSLHLCKELEFIHKSCCTVGYRPNVFSTTLSHLIATNCGHLLLPFVSIRERLKDKVEEFFGCEYELFIEFTGLISWTKGASIGWHSDDNRSYLKQRDFAVVCYLNSHGKDFNGGLFHFQDGAPTTVVPMAGDGVMYTADNRNIHSVDEIVNGERLTLTLWFTRDSSHDEDVKLISLLSQSPMLNSVDAKPLSFYPFPAPNNMYWFSQDQASNQKAGFDIRWARIHILGYTFCASDHKSYDSASDSSFDLSETLMKPLWLARENEIFSKEFINSLHALQVVQFYCWKSTELQPKDDFTEPGNMTQLSKSLTDRSSDLKSMFLGDQDLADTVFHSLSSDKEVQPSFHWVDFSVKLAAWEDYSCQLLRELIIGLPNWKTHQSIFSVPALSLKKGHHGDTQELLQQLLPILQLLVSSSYAELQRFEHPTKSDGSLSFLVVGDWGRRGLYNQSHVAFQMGKIGEKLDIDFVISTGDNFYDDGLTGINDPAFADSFTNIYTAKSLQKQWYNVLGNHDYRGDVEAQLSRVLRKIDSRWVCLRSFLLNAEIVEFFFVDTTPFVEKYFTEPEDHKYDWRGVTPREDYIANHLKEVESALRESNAKWKFVVGHHTMRTAGHHGDTQELLQQLLPILQANNVDLYINGHDHCLEHISSTDQSGIEFLTSGGGSKAWRGDINNHIKGLNFYYDGQGFMSIEMNQFEAKILFYDAFGKVLHHFNMYKQEQQIYSFTT